MAVGLEELRVGPGAHVVHFYADDAELARTVGGYLVEALQDGAVAVAIATEDHRRLLEAELRTAGLDPAQCRRDGTLITLDAAATMAGFVRAGTVNHDGFDRVIGAIVHEATQTGREVRAFGEMVALLWEDGDVLAALELERAWNRLAHRLPFALVCGYRSESVEGDELTDALGQVCRLHTAVINPRAAGDTAASGPPAAPGAEASAQFAAANESPREARRFVAAALERWGQRGTLLHDAQLLVTELATNAVVHAHSPFSVRLRRDAGVVRLAVRDGSRNRPILRPPDPFATSGRGLQVVAALAAAWGVEPDAGGKTVWAELRA